MSAIGPLWLTVVAGLRPWEELTGQIYLGSEHFMMQPQLNRVI